jgi:riboflavin kinase/FMN adenylyltransferase
VRHFDDLSAIQLEKPSIVTIGVFDGVHLGHQFLTQALVDEAQATDRLSVVLSFHPHPDRVLRGATGRYYLSTLAQRRRWLAGLGVDVEITHPFDDQVRQVRAAAFIDQLLAHLSMRSLWVTADFALGYKREGDFAYLTAQGIEKGFDVRAIELVTRGAQAIRSTSIRDALALGDVGAAAAMLGRPYQIEGEVVHGDGRGSLTGFPTANIAVWDEQIIPANGVYACIAHIDDARYKAVTNIGTRPTFNGQDMRIEAHLLDFTGDLYGKTVSLDFITRLRGEEKFNSVAALIEQIAKDVARGHELLEEEA